MASYRKWTPREPPLAPVETLDAIAAGRAHVRQAELQDKSAVAATRLQSMVRGRKQKSKYAQMLYDALLLKEGTSKASSSNSEADAQFRRRKAVEELDEELQARRSIMFAESENAALGCMSLRRTVPCKGSSRQLYISGILAEARADTAAAASAGQPVPSFSRLVSAAANSGSGSATSNPSTATVGPPPPSTAAVPDNHTARSSVLARMRRIPSSTNVRSRVVQSAAHPPPAVSAGSARPPYPPLPPGMSPPIGGAPPPVPQVD